jgi:hypothetical protein
MKTTGRRTSRMRRSRQAWLLAAGLALAGATTLGVHASASAEEKIKMEPGPGRHFFMFIDNNDAPGENRTQYFDAEARILQDGREIVKLGGAHLEYKYSKHWTWYGHSGEQVEVRIKKGISENGQSITWSD